MSGGACVASSNADCRRCVVWPIRFTPRGLYGVLLRMRLLIMHRAGGGGSGGSGRGSGGGGGSGIAGVRFLCL